VSKINYRKFTADTKDNVKRGEAREKPIAKRVAGFLGANIGVRYQISGGTWPDIDCYLLLSGVIAYALAIKSRDRDRGFFKTIDPVCPLRCHLAATGDYPYYFVNETIEGDLLIFDLKCPISTGLLRYRYTRNGFDQEDRELQRSGDQDSAFFRSTIFILENRPYSH